MRLFRTFTFADTHGLLTLPTCQVRFSTENCGWSSLFVSYQSEAPFHADLHPLDHHLIVLHLTGPVRIDGNVDDNPSSKVVSPGCIGFWPAGRKFSITLRDQLETIHLYLSSTVMRKAADQLGYVSGKISYRPLFAIKDELLEQLIMEAWRVAAKRSDRSNLYADQVALSIATRLVWINAQAIQEPECDKGLTSAQLEKIRNHIDQNLDSHLRLQDLSDLIGHSASYFSRQFKNATSKSPHQFIVVQRVERAKRLLRHTTNSIAEIALDCGFSHQEHLTHVFRRIAGVTPGSYRKASHDSVA
ncbi:helix-turn-helix transcriptional regulator [Rhodopseudomonas sp. P2A-2r]|uniref:helix-turn-helix transcriptional regulator n=1 Tax=unclassified Rhodopseudomonas TaxID=2638247 RepID=UPI0022347EB9|nr:AraC family transcriptional regulator [Rhodopseudomonas sp. P2A-2r]UZE50681.1 AraC family transcriptional regulator [Rhodopseudomonas sp. P2A-2r]